MYQIDEEAAGETYTLLIPAMLDAHFPLLKYAFYSEEYRPVIMEEAEGLTQTAFTYVQNELCYPVILMIGQTLKALQSGEYDLNRTVVLEPQIRDVCRGVNYIPMLRDALDNAGFSMVPVLSLNVTKLENIRNLPVTTDLLLRAVAAAYYGDLLMILSNQTKPYENHIGDTERISEKWKKTLAEDLKHGNRLSLSGIRERFSEII
ncbi:MAG: 2-hydroxyacyl-CoA dehydratase, partial [Lachnospiraceae bacterium]|nr:2-hydroxyacyl-CoA dehydratase [Lachnospiraceae bacterium]